MNRRTVVALIVVAVGVLVAVVAALMALRPSGEWWHECDEERIAVIGEEAAADRRLTDDYIDSVRIRHSALFENFPHYNGHGIGALEYQDEQPVGPYGIIVGVMELIDQRMLPEESRIPACIEGVPIMIEIEPAYRQPILHEIKPNRRDN